MLVKLKMAGIKTDLSGATWDDMAEEPPHWWTETAEKWRNNKKLQSWLVSYALCDWQVEVWGALFRGGVPLLLLMPVSIPQAAGANQRAFRKHTQLAVWLYRAAGAWGWGAFCSEGGKSWNLHETRARHGEREKQFRKITGGYMGVW